MKEQEEAPQCADCLTHKAIRNYSNARFGSLARDASAELERFVATGMFGHQDRFRTWWDEYCHAVQERPHGTSEIAFATTVGPVVLAIVRAIGNSEAVLLTIGARGHFDENREVDQDVVAAPDLIQRNLEDAIETLAMFRDMSEFDRADEEGPYPSVEGRLV
jgi:hypothetical protein